jgi:hypothetical protein
MISGDISGVVNINGAAYPPAPPAPDLPTQWAVYPAVQDVDMSGNDILRAGDVSADSITTDFINAPAGLFIDGLTKVTKTQMLYFDPSTNEVTAEAVVQQTLSQPPGTDDLTISDGNTVDIGAISSIQLLNLRTAEIVHLLGSDETTVSGVRLNQGDISCNTLTYTTLSPPIERIFVNTLYVNDGVTDIQAAIDAATPATQILMSPGSYGGSTVTIDGKSNIAIIGPTRGQQTICELAAGRGLSLEATSTGAITIANLQIEGLMTLAGLVPPASPADRQGRGSPLSGTPARAASTAASSSALRASGALPSDMLGGGVSRSQSRNALMMP